MKRAGSAEAMRSAVKRSPLRLDGWHPVEITPDEESVTLNREQTGYGCSSSELWEAENRLFASRSRSVGRSQDHSLEWDLAWKKSSRRQRKNPRLTRATVDRRRKGAHVVR